MNPKKSFVVLILILTSLFLQFVLHANNVVIVIAALALAFVPPLICSEPNESHHDDNAEAKEKWRSIALSDYKDIFYRIVHQKLDVIDLHWYGRIFAFFTAIGWLIAALFISYFMFDIGYTQEAFILFDIVAIPRALFIMVYDRTPHGAVNGKQIDGRIQEKARCAKEMIEYLEDTGYTASEDALEAYHFDIDPRIQIQKIEDEYTFKDLRIDIKPKTEMPDLLCAMISLNINVVKEKNYPFAYGVFVFKGKDMVCNEDVCSRLHKIMNRPGSFFHLESKCDEEGNSVFVMLSNGGYHTKRVHCIDLIHAIIDAIPVFASCQ